MALHFEKYAQKGNEFLGETAYKLGLPGDREKAGRIVRAGLHGLRDQLAVEASIQLLAQLPLFLKAVYVDGWKTPVDKRAHIHHVADFIAAVKRADGRTGQYDFPDDEHAEIAIKVVFSALRKYVSAGEMSDIEAELPKALKPLVRESATQHL